MVLIAVVVAAGGLLAPISAAGAAEQLAEVDVTRYGGADRYATSLIAAEAVAAHAGGTLDSIIMVSGQSWTDAVVAAPLAGSLRTAVLATPPDTLRADAKAFLQRTGVSRALIIGAASASDGVGAEIESELKGQGIAVERIAGSDHYEISVAAARRLGQPGDMGDKGGTVIVASGEVFADALVAGAFAARGPHPVLLTPQARLHPDVSDYLRSASVRHVVMMGGRAALHGDVEDSLTSLGIEVTRLAGATRYDTAAKAARLAVGSYGKDCFTSRQVGVARATVPFDSFSAGPLLARLCAPLLLADRDQMPAETADFLSEARATAASSGDAAVALRVFGGDAAVSQASVNGYISDGAVPASSPLETVDYSRIDGLLSSIGALDATEGCPDPAAPVSLEDHIEVVSIRNGCVLIEYEPLEGRTLAEARSDLAQDAAVVAADLPVTRFGISAPYDYTTGDPDAGQQWFLPEFDAKALWDGWPAGAQVTVAVIDTGVDASHSDLVASVVSTGSSCHRRDFSSHGTHVSGIVAAEAGNGIALAGIAPQASLLPIKLPLGNAPIDSGCAQEVSSAAQAIQKAVEQGVDVINMSFGRPLGSTEPFPTTLDTVIHLAATSDVVMVAAAGNRGDRLANRNAKEIPASHPDVISVAATAQDGTRAAFSTANRWVDIAAPGQQIYSTVPCKPPEGCTGDNYNGTSMAAPMISGIAAHLKARYPQATAAQIREALLSTALQPQSTQTGVRTDAFGWGIAQPHAAIKALGAAVGDVTAPPAVSNSAPRFTSPTTASVRENTTHVLRVVAVDDDPQDHVSTYGITAGADRAAFEIDAVGNVAFTTAPDYDSPHDENGDNVYEVVLTATSGSAERLLTSTQNVRVTVTDDRTEAPPSPTNQRYAFQGSSIVLNWDAVADADYYKVYHDDAHASSCNVRSGRATFCDDLAGNVLGISYIHTNPDPNKNYYWVVACNTSSCSEIDSDRPATTVGSVPTGPNPRYAFEGMSIVLSWDAVAGADYYRVYHDSFFESSCTVRYGRASFCDLLAGDVSGTSYTHASPDPDDNHYWVAACNSSGCSQVAGGSPATPIGTAPAVPVARYAFDGSSIVLSWDAVAGADFYRVYYDDFFSSGCSVGAGGGVSFCELLAGSVTATTYTHTSPDPDDNYYWVAACNSSGCSQVAGGSPATPTGAGPGTTLPDDEDEDDESAPDLVVDTPTVTDTSPTAGTSFTLNATVRNQGSGRSASTTLRYYRSADSTITTADTPAGTDTVSRLDASATSAESAGVTAPSTAGTYYYGACVDTVSDESDTTNNCSLAVTVTVGTAESGIAEVVPIVGTVAGGTSSSLRLNIFCRNGIKCRNDVTHYELSRSTNDTDNFQVVDSSVAQGHYVDSGLEPETIYYYMTRACNASECSQFSNQVGGITEAEGEVAIPSIPQGLGGEKVDIRLETDDARIWWNPVPSATYYQVYQSGTDHLVFEGDDLDAVIFGPRTSYYDGDPNRIFLFGFATTYYRVAACNKSGCSDKSPSIRIS